jgi:hypothetical protein
MILLTATIVLVALLTYLLLAPIDLVLNSYQNRYLLRWGWIGKATFSPAGDLPLVQLSAGPFSWRWSLEDLVERAGRSAGRQQSPASKDNKPVGRKKTRKKRFPKRLILNLMKSFRIKACRLELDTNDYVWNAWLYIPLGIFPVLQRYVTVNFEGRNALVFHLQNRLWWLGVAAFRSQITRK